MKKLYLILFLCLSAFLLKAQTAEDFYSSALTKYHEGNFKAAIADFTRSIELDPSFSSYIRRGEARLQIEDEENAILDFDKAIALRPDLSETYHYRGMAKQRTKKYNDAIKDFDMAISISKKYAQALCSRAEVKLKLKDVDGAFNDYKEAMLANPEDQFAFLGYAQMCIERGDKESACNAFRKSSDLGNKDAESAWRKNCK